MQRTIKAEKIIKSLLIICLLAEILLFVYQDWYIYYYNKLEVLPYKNQYIYVWKMEYPPNSQIKALIDDLYDTPHITIHKNIPRKSTPAYSIVQYRIVFMDIDLSGVDYAISYAHELTHIKHQTADETWTTFYTWKTLIESDNEFLQNAGFIYESRIMCGGYEGTEYDCGYYIENYRKGQKA